MAIARLRAERGLRQRDLAASAGLDQASLSQIENGHWNPALENVAKICGALGVRLSKLAEVAEQIEAEQSGGR
jgi:transcriptional regulator with XRE-family HTH domain